MAYSSNKKLKAKLRKTLIEVLDIDCEHPDDAEMSTYITNRLDRAHVPYKIDNFGNIIAKLPGEGDPLLLSTHIDIPEPIPRLDYRIENDIIKSDGNGILGVDPKTGLVILLEYLVDMASAKNQAHYSALEVVFTRGEEKGLLGAKHLDYSLLESRTGLVLDEDGPVENVVTQAPTCIYVDAFFTGKAAHPREPEKASNALAAANDAIQDLPWGFTDTGVMWNIGTLQAGTARNTVPGTVELKGELRSYDKALAMDEAERIKATLQAEAQRHGVDCSVDFISDTEGYVHDADAPIIRLLACTYAAIGRTPHYYDTLGRSDANIFNEHGISTAAIGSGYYNAHQYSEYANLQDMTDVYTFIEQFDAVHARYASLAHQPVVATPQARTIPVVSHA